MTVSAPANSNYCATVVALSAFVDLPNCDNVKAALIFGNSVIVGKDTQPGAVGLFFPAETQLMRDFLANNNLFRKPEWGNVDPEKKGFFEEHGRVKTMKFRGHKSEGFWIPIASLAYLGVTENDLPVGTEFDTIGDRVICKKYVPRFQSRVGSGKASGSLSSSIKLRNERMVPNQFRFHPDTSKLEKHIYAIQPDDYISISDKWHGTSAVFANVLVKRRLSLLERIARFCGAKVQEQEYGFTWSSRKVVKGINEGIKTGGHYYFEDIWGVVAKEIRDRIPKGVTVYGEIVGYTSDGSPIQKGYHYGCGQGSHKFLVYRVTVTNEDGQVFEMPWLQMKKFCAHNGLEMVKELYYGKANDFYGILSESVTEWQQTFFNEVKRMFVRDEMCPFNSSKVPAEGIVLRIDRLTEAEAYKCKNFAFLDWETKQLDAGELDMETAESEQDEAADAA